MILRFLCLLAASASASWAQDRAPVEPQSLPAPDQAVAPVKPSVEKLDETHYRIGQVTFDQKTREISFPAKVNMSEGLLEFLVVHTNGKLHESLFTTDISATHLNLAFTLLRYPASRELYAIPGGQSETPPPPPEIPAEVKSGARIAIDVEWKDGERTRRVPVNEWIQHSVNSTTMPAGPWVYGGSEIENGKFAPEATGDIIAIFTTNSALINYPGSDHGNDEVWTAFPKRVPATGIDVTVIIRPFNPAKP
jgi:hypothetical protein